MSTNNTQNNIVRIGKVSSTDPVKHTVRVAFEDKDGMISADLPVLVRNSLKNKDYNMPDVNEQVVCIFLPNGVAQGFCLGSFYSSADTPPVTSQDKRHVNFGDGTSVEYDRKIRVMTINCAGAINIIAKGNVNVTGDVIADGISLTKHTHPESIGSVTGPPS